MEFKKKIKPLFFLYSPTFPYRVEDLHLQAFRWLDQSLIGFHTQPQLQSTNQNPEISWPMKTIIIFLELVKITFFSMIERLAIMVFDKR